MNIIRLNSIGEPFAKSGQATPPSGGGTEASSMEYLDVSGYALGAAATSPFSFMVKGNMEGIGQYVMPTTYAFSSGMIGNGIFPIAIGIDFSAKILSKEVQTTVLDSVLQSITIEQLSSIPRLTEEEFYTI